MIPSNNFIAVKFQHQLKIKNVYGFIEIHIPDNCDINILGNTAFSIDLIAQKKCTRRKVAAFPKERYGTPELGRRLFSMKAGTHGAPLYSKVEND